MATRLEETRVAAVLAESVDALANAGVPYVVIGGVAAAAYGAGRTSEDIDVLVDPADAVAALEALAAVGFETEQTNPQWIYKAWKDEVPIDVIFRLKSDICLDDAMLERARVREYAGVPIPLIPPEDLIVVKAVTHDEHTPRHWTDALAVVGEVELDWDYLIRRARRGARRVLALLLYAQSNDLVVTDDVIRALFDSIYGDTP